MVALLLLLGGRASFDAWRNPQFGAWLGFGIGYINPVPEAEFLASQQLGPRMYNLFDSGGYLLWRLYPQYRVMVDVEARIRCPHPLVEFPLRVTLSSLTFASEAFDAARRSPTAEEGLN